MLLTHNIYKNFLDSLIIPPEKRSEEDIERMLPYINTLTSFINSLRQANLKSYNDTLREICQNMTLCSIPKDRFVVKYGEKGNVFYIILNGSISIIIVKNKNGYLSEEEYIEHLLQLRKNKETELLKMTLVLNHNVYKIEGNFLYNIQFISIIFKFLSFFNYKTYYNKKNKIINLKKYLINNLK